ncbi:MAG: response regulator [Verrucomicrobia bacterium]|nr:response regulator [Verrucomicrobiota bacterium]
MLQFFRSTPRVPAAAPAGAAPVPSGLPPSAASGSAGAVILVVDDSTMIRSEVSRTLAARGYEILQATNGREGLTVWEQNKERITLVLSDVFMPEVDGLTMAKELRRRSRGLPIVLMSSKLDEDSRWVAEEAGFRLMPKPFKDAYLLELVARMIRLRAAG